MISNGSRYSSSPVVNLVVNGKARKVISTPSVVDITQFNFQAYQVTGADTIDSLANMFYGDTGLWWAIANANPEIMQWHYLAPGTIIRIPNLQSVVRFS